METGFMEYPIQQNKCKCNSYHALSIIGQLRNIQFKFDIYDP